MVSLGGDHFISYPLLRAHAAKHGPLSLVHFDAHRDVEPDAAAASIMEPCSTMPFAMA